MRSWLSGLCVALLLSAPAAAAEGTPQVTKQALPPVAGDAAQPKPDLGQGRTLYTVGYAHLDTEWRWAFPQVIKEFLPNTLHQNFALFEKYPDYVFNFTGANRYMLMKEYYPEDYARLKQYIAQGRWVPNGSSMEEGDVVVPSPESIIRQVLYGNQFFEQEFGQSSDEFMLPDCFGFPASFPSILAHCGLKGFSTQKLSWGSAAGIPFNVGVWEGPDGRSVVAALNPGAYVGEIKEDLSNSPDWLKRIEANGDKSGVYADYHYFGTGDTGGAPTVGSVRWLEESLRGRGPVRVVTGRADQLFRDILPAQQERLPHYSGDLLLTQHSAGSITSQSYMKRWNRKNELLADAAEKAAVAADWLGAAQYPRAKLKEAWRLTLASQFHDQLPGTASPLALEYAYNNEALAQNMFADVLSTSVAGVASGLDTSGEGVPVVVYNPLSTYREDVVECTVEFPDNDQPAQMAYVTTPDGQTQHVQLRQSAIPQGVKVVDQDGREVPAQLVSQVDHSVKLLFAAHVPSVGFAVYHVVPAAAAPTTSGELTATASSLENDRYRVQLNPAGDVGSIYDKQAKRELLKAPLRLAFTHDQPGYWPAWNMDWEQANEPPYAYVDGPAQIRLVESGPVRATLEVTRSAQGSQFIQRISLAAGGERVEFHDTINWRGKACNLKATFPLTVSNPEATYNWEVGTIKRGNNDPKKYEVPSHQWFDLTDKSGDYGVTVLCPFKYGSDKPDDNTLRLTLLRTPGPIINKEGKIDHAYEDQTWQDWGVHEITYGLAGHPMGWQADAAAAGKRLEQPLLAFQCEAHDGTLAREFSMISIGLDRHSAQALGGHYVQIQALKKAEDNAGFIVRLIEPMGAHDGELPMLFGEGILSATVVDGQERPLAEAKLDGEHLWFKQTPYQLQSFRLGLRPPVNTLAKSSSEPLPLPYNTSVSNNHGEAATGGFDGDGRGLASEMLPHELTDGGVQFRFAPMGGGQQDAVECKGQTIAMPQAPQGGKAYKVELTNACIAVQLEFDHDGGVSADTIKQINGLLGKYDYDYGQLTSYAHLKEMLAKITAAEAAPAEKFSLYQEALFLKGLVEADLTTEVTYPAGGPYNKLCFIAAAAPQDQTAQFKFDTGGTQTLTIQDWGGFVGQPDTRLWDGDIPDMVFNWTYPLVGLAPGYMKPAHVAWYSSHRRDAYGGDLVYSFSYLYRYSLDVPPGATSVTLPDNPNIKILAMTAADDPAAGCRPAQPLVDTFEGHTPEALKLELGK
jgi:alpha-mannosidase